MSQCRVIRKGLVRAQKCRLFFVSRFLELLFYSGRVRVLFCIFFSFLSPLRVTERERQTDEKNVFPAPNAHDDDDDEPGAPVSLEQGEKPRRAEKAKTPSRGTIGVEIRDFRRGVERKKKCARRRRSFATTTRKVERKRADLRAIRQLEQRRRC